MKKAAKPYIALITVITFAALAGAFAGPQAEAQALTADEERALALLNADRAVRGLAPLRPNLTLTAMARAHAQDMIDRGYASHDTPEGETFAERLDRWGVAYQCAGENLAKNRSVEAAERALMDSAVHRANILSPDFTEVGVGVRADADGSVYVVQDFIGR